jgi:hypothetical protein
LGIVRRRKKEEGRRKKQEGRSKKEEARSKKQEARSKKQEGRALLIYSMNDSMGKNETSESVNIAEFSSYSFSYPD